MTEQPRVAVYLDFDNMVISRYDAEHGKGAWRRDEARGHTGRADSDVDRRLAQAGVDIGAIIDYATSFGTVAFTRAYADWSVPANAAYRHQLVDRAVDLVQLFATSGTKNGADIRLSIDAVDDLFQHADLSHVVFAAGDSDYIALAQRCKRMGRYVVGIGVSGSASKALAAACDEFAYYTELPGVREAVRAKPAKNRAAKATPPPEPAPQPDQKPDDQPEVKDREADATDLLLRALRVGLAKSDDEWLDAGGVKSQMQRLDPAFNEKALGHSSFRAFVASRSQQVQTRTDGNQMQIRLP